MDEDLTVKARIDDELSAPLENIREDLHRVGDEATIAGRRASSSSRGWATMGKVAKAALVGIGTGVAAAGYATYRLMKSSISQASNLNESLNAVNVSYGKQAKAVKQLGREAAKSIGMSNVEFNSMAVQFSSFAKTIGGGGKGTVKTLDAITTRAADFASVMNIEVAEATALFQSGLAGESEPLRKYGINLSAAAVGAYAVKAGLSESATEMTDAAKIQATYGLLMEKTNNTQGDFKNTSDSLANSSRILSARFDNVQAKLGKALLPIMGKVVGYLNREGIPAFKRFSDWFTEDGLPAIERFADKARTLYQKHLPQIKSTLSDVRDVVEPVAKAAGDMVEAFLNMPSWARKLLVGAGVGAVIASKLKVPKVLSTAAGVTGKLGVQKVFETNPLALGGGGPDVPGGKKPSRFPPIIPTSFPKLPAIPKVFGTLPKFLKFGAIPGIGSAPGEDSLMKKLTGFGLSGGGDGPKEASPAQHKEFEAAARAVDQYGDTSVETADRMQAAFKKLPAVIQTKFITGNVPQTTSEVVELARTYDLTKKERRTLFAAAGVPDVESDLGGLLGLYELTEKPRTARVAADTTAALAAISRVQTAISGLSGTAYVDLTPRGLGSGKNGREYGGSVKAGESYVVGERRAELFVPDRSGTILPRVPHSSAGGGTVTVERGAIVINNPASDIDLERAITAGIKNYVREREERE